MGVPRTGTAGQNVSRNSAPLLHRRLVRDPLKLSDFDYDLPPELIAQHPAAPRDAARLMVVDRGRGTIAHHSFSDLPGFLTSSDVLVLNDTRVIPARLRAKKPGGGAVELLLLRRVGGDPNDPLVEHWEALVRPGRRARRGSRLEVTGDVSGEVMESLPNGARLIRFSASRPLLEVAHAIGEMPVPPYIHESLRRPDDYQTVYAQAEGAVAAPTAGLHFTPELLARISDAGTQIVTITLHIGLGTFRPVSAERIEEHVMDEEWFEISAQAADAISKARGRVVVVGTSAVRALETAASPSLPSSPSGGEGRIPVKPARGWSRLFIYPGYRFNVTDALVTNFHLPKTTLLMLVSAFAGRERTTEAYREAVHRRYRFYSFGDAMLIV